MTNDTTPKNSIGKNSSGKVGLKLAVVAALLAGAYGVYAINGSKSNIQDGEKSATGETGQIVAAPVGLTKELSSGALRAFLVHKTRKEMPKLAFKDGSGKDLTLDGWKGRVVLLNLWATWCGPCRREMPHLAELQEKFGGDDFEVVALSVDRKGAEASGRFLVEAKSTALNLYVDRTSKALGLVRARGLPVTLLIDRKGREAGRLLGPAVWNGPDAVRLIKTAIAEKK